jgi:hypothetical protein
VEDAVSIGLPSKGVLLFPRHAIRESRDPLVPVGRRAGDRIEPVFVDPQEDLASGQGDAHGTHQQYKVDQCFP